MNKFQPPDNPATGQFWGWAFDGKEWIQVDTNLAPTSQTMNFSQAIEAVKEGNMVKRRCWPKKRLSMKNAELVMYDERRQWRWDVTMEDIDATDYVICN